MSDAFVGEIRLFAGNFAPTGWALCNGQLLPISQNTALFSLLGTTYGGDGKSTFALPNLQGRMPLGAGSGPGLTSRDLGEASGEAQHTLTLSEMPQHNHAVQSAVAPDSKQPSPQSMWARSSDNTALYHAQGNAAPMAGTAVQGNGAGWAHNNQHPALVLNFIIAMQGIYPPRQ
ncbi:tail collar protein [Aquabacterium sp. NJ1]|uniref:phage tail protein n=1 Tax=Aquabacterium sp. NJ1 TaxID=1538295 RepID=UPI00052C23A6|nr:tail fiber protein [Aquabacterium sp. NJ1]KGM40533.1 tail collar protein [Aquabacterium sp. NJ1]